LSTRSPYILLTFANPNKPSGFLSSLDEEIRKVEGHLDPFNATGACKIEVIVGATTASIYDKLEVWQSANDLLVFHYGGHAEEDSLELNTAGGETRAAGIKGLAKSLGEMDSLHLLVLNGCATQGQVDEFLGGGVKVVIATNNKINDRMAVDFADRLYSNLAIGESIGSSFERAKRFIQDTYKGDAADSLFIDDEDEEDEANGFDIPWGLYTKPGISDSEREKLLAWKLPFARPLVAVDQKTLIPQLERYTCDRVAQSDTFDLKFRDLRDQQAKVQHYFIHGEDLDSPTGLFYRFALDPIPKAYSGETLLTDHYEDNHTFHKVVVFQEASSLESAKNKLVTALFSQLQVNANSLPRSELTLKKLVETAPPIKSKSCVCIQLRVSSSAWKDYTEEFIRWFTEDFSDPSKLPSHAPDFIFFFSVVYDKEAQGGFFGRLLKKSPKAKITSALTKFPIITPLAELDPVHKRDIDSWLAEKTTDALVKEEFLNQHFANKSEWEMAKLEPLLEKIIETLNT